jgi:hypothetical protein
MTEAELFAAVRRLRLEGRSPKEIARSLGFPRATISPMIRLIAEESSGDGSAGDLIGCWVSQGWSHALDIEGHPFWPRGHRAPGCEGLANVVVAREYRKTRISVCSFLVDTYCLGVKETIGPRCMDREKLRVFNGDLFDAYGADPLTAPIDLAQHLVFGAVEYARQLGFEPGGEFSECQGHLGVWSGPSAIRFGRHGSPVYVAGPYDDPVRIIRTLERSVGRGNFDHVVGLEDAV